MLEKTPRDHQKDRQLLELSSQFYTFIPTDVFQPSPLLLFTSQFGHRAVQPLDNFDILRRKMKQIEALADIQVASNLLSTRSLLGQNPSDANYDMLGTKYLSLLPSM